MNFVPFVIAWIGLGVTTLALAAYRKFLTTHEDDYIHLEEWAKPAADRQVAAAHRLHLIDRWGETMTVLMAVTGVVLAGLYLYAAWHRG